MYRCGYCNLVVKDNIQTIVQLINYFKQQCEKVVIGIPDEQIFARLFGADLYSSEKAREEIIVKTQVDDVIILSDSNSYEKLYELIHFDIVFYGGKFGKTFASFQHFAEKNNIYLCSMIPETYSEVGYVDALKIALENLQKHQKIVLFGAGTYFDIYMKHYGKRFRPKYVIDNSKKIQGRVKNGISIFSPEVLKNEIAEDLLIIICAKDYEDILKQLYNFGNFDYRLLLYNNPISLMEEYSLSRSKEIDYLNKAHTILSEMLKEFDRLCCKYHLHYYVICGSLIGVLRHKGFIPWDDDVDVAMPRDDYERLRIIAQQEWEKSPYRVLGFEQLGNGAFLDCMPRVIYLKDKLPMKVYDKVLGRASEDIINRPFLDIYVMDNAFDNDRKHMINMFLMKGVYNFLMGHRGKVDYEEYSSRYSSISIFIMKCAHTFGSFIPLPILVYLFEHLSKKANKLQCENYFMPSCAITCIERKFKKRFFGNGKRMPFQDFEVTIPSDYNGLMEAMGYHNYMQFPIMAIRKPSHYFNSDIIIW